MTAAPSARPLLLACLCAAWCGTCRDYLPVFEQVAAASGLEVEAVWIDIEDEAEVLGDLDVEDFPTLLIARAEVPLFFGPVMPHAPTLARLLRSAAAGELPPQADPALAGLLQRLRARSPGG